MMGIDSSWNQFNQQKDSDLTALMQSGRLPKISSHHPLDRIRRLLRFNMGASILVCLCYFGILFRFHYWQVQATIFVTLCFSLYAFYSAFLLYRRLDTRVSADRPLLMELKKQRDSILKWMASLQQLSLWVYPAAAAGGFMLGGILGSGKTVEAFMAPAYVKISLLVTIVLLAPLGYFLSRWLCQRSFGKHLRSLEDNIQELEGGETGQPEINPN
jgi:hypothetical protein